MWRHLRRMFAAVAIGATMLRGVVLAARVIGAIGTLDAAGNAVGLGPVLEPYETWFDAHVTAPVFDAAMRLIG